MGWFQNNWPEWLVVAIPALLGLGALWWYSRSHRTSLLAAVAGFTFLAAAVLGGALWAAGVPQAVFGNLDLTQANGASQPDAIWKVTQSVTLTFGALGLVAASVIAYHRQRSQQQQVQATQEQVKLELDKFNQEKDKYQKDQARETERRRQERYAQGAHMVADESPAVRIAGLNVIAVLGREVPVDDELRQTSLNLICAYLRVASPASTDEHDEAAEKQFDKHREVTAEACRLLPTLLVSLPADNEGPLLDLDLRDTTLIELDLHSRRIGPARLECAALNRANLIGADLYSANLRGADLKRADLSGANLDSANLWGADLTHANLSGANLRGADLTHANLWGAKMSGADLTHANLIGAYLGGANLRGANLTDANLTDAKMSGADLTHTNLGGANLSGANLTLANLTGADLDRANLAGADLDRANLCGADLDLANLAGANLNGVHCDGETRWPTGFASPNPPVEAHD